MMVSAAVHVVPSELDPLGMGRGHCHSEQVLETHPRFKHHPTDPKTYRGCPTASGTGVASIALRQTCVLTGGLANSGAGSCDFLLPGQQQLFCCLLKFLNVLDSFELTGLTFDFECLPQRDGERLHGISTEYLEGIGLSDQCRNKRNSQPGMCVSADCCLQRQLQLARIA